VCRAQSFASDLRGITRGHGRMKCYALGLGLDTFRMVALTQNFRRLDLTVLLSAFNRWGLRNPLEN
jgi:hypothetical protein